MSRKSAFDLNVAIEELREEYAVFFKRTFHIPFMITNITHVLLYAHWLELEHSHWLAKQKEESPHDETP